MDVNDVYPCALHLCGLPDIPIAERIAHAEPLVASQGGHEVNRIDPGHLWVRNQGRPLYFALDHTSSEQLEWIQWLLDHGADPRLYGASGVTSPIDQVRSSLHGLRVSSHRDPKATEELRDWYTTVLNMMMDKAKALNAREKATRAEGAEGDKEVDCLCCRNGTSHTWHYFCFVGTEEEARTTKRRNNLMGNSEWAKETLSWNLEREREWEHQQGAD